MLQQFASSISSSIKETILINNVGEIELRAFSKKVVNHLNSFLLILTHYRTEHSILLQLVIAQIRHVYSYILFRLFQLFHISFFNFIKKNFGEGALCIHWLL